MADLDYWVNAMERRGDVPADFRKTQAYYDFYQELGIGYYLQGLFPFEPIYDADVQVNVQWIGNHKRTTIHTPLGTLTDEWVYLPESFADAPTKRFVETPADLRMLRYVFEHTTYLPDHAELLRRPPMIGEQGVLLAYLPRSPFMQMVTELCKMETLVDLWVEAPLELEETLQVIEYKHDQAAQIALDSPAECLMIPENLSSELIGKRFFERFLRSYETRWVERIRQAGKFSFIHMDGTLKGLMREVSSVGFDVIEAVTPAPVGDLNFQGMRQLSGPEAILWGGIPGVYFTDLVDDNEFDRLIIDVLSIMRQDPHYVLGVADQVPPAGLRYRVERVAELVDKYGVY